MVIEAEAVLPTPPLVDPTLPLRLFLTPALRPTTSTATVQVPPAAIAPPEKLRPPAAAAAGAKGFARSNT